MTLLKALLATSGIFGFSIFMAWLGNQGAIGIIAVLTIVFIGITYVFYDIFKQ